MTMSCFVPESEFVRPPERFSLHDAIEAGDNGFVRKILDIYNRQLLADPTLEIGLRRVSLDEKG